MSPNPAPDLASVSRRSLLRRSLVAVLFASALPCSAAQQSLAWDPSTGAVAGYYVFYGTTSGNYTTRLDARMQNSLTITNLADGGTYYFVAAAYDAAGTLSGYSNEVSATMSVPTSAPPTAGLSATPTTGDAPLTVTFASVSGGNITSYLWNFGDGATSTEQNPQHTYSTIGTFGFTLTVTGPGGSSSATGTVTTSGCRWRNKKKC